MAVVKRLVDDDPEEEHGLVPIRWITQEEAFAALDLQARRRLNLSGAEFLEKWRADAFSDEFKDEHHSAFAVLSLMAVPFGK